MPGMERKAECRLLGSGPMTALHSIRTFNRIAPNVRKASGVRTPIVLLCAIELTFEERARMAACALKVADSL